ncbi:tetratricopeptide repeat protein [Streptomyces sp. NBC_01450]|uniref:tetratricopeptide repeat protein n=1 Tax=Streptomyces sp. NBC_01450 TaxID=2903871 RepID=UPI002E303201|nr:tetratricopeptide repeat protein [Streptomyces sp. NBC_01450]
MEIEERQPVLTGLTPQGPSRRRPSVAKHMLIGLVAGAVVLGGVLVLLPSERRTTAAPSPGPVARAVTAVGAGVPAALPDLAALIGDHEAHLRAHPRDERSWAVLGAAYVEQGRRTATPAYFPKAEQALRTSLQTNPKGNPTALEGLAALANARSDFKTGRKWAEEALKQAPKRWTAYPLLIDSCTGLGDYKASRAALEKLQGLHHGPPVLAEAARVYWDRGWREDAMASLADAAAGATAPAERATWLAQSGRLAWERGDREESLRYYEAALSSDPDQRGALAGQGRALAALGRSAEALRAYQTAFAQEPDPRYALELGELYETLGVRDAAQTQYALLRERVRTDASAGVDDELVLGLFEADHGDPEEAVRRLREEWKRQPGIAVADALGWALHRAEEDEEALKFATKATDKTAGGGVRSALYVYHRGEIERELGLSGSARRHIAESLQINPYFSPVLAPQARRALTDLGEPAPEPLPEPKDTAPAEPEGAQGPPGAPARPANPAAPRPPRRPTAQAPAPKPAPHPTTTPPPPPAPSPPAPPPPPPAPRRPTSR